MSSAFDRSLETLLADRSTRTVGILVTGTAMLVVWCFWCVSARIRLYESTSSARLEVDRATYPLQASVSGRVTSASLIIGQRVQAGDALVEIDSTAEQFRMREECAQLTATRAQTTAVQLQIDAEQETRSQEEALSRLASEQAITTARQAEAPARFNAADQERLKQLHANGLIAERDYEKGQTEAQQSSWGWKSQQIAVHRIEQEQRMRRSDRESRIRALRAEITRLEGQTAISSAAIDRLKNEIERRIIRAPVTGRIAEASTLRKGAVLEEGEKFGVIIPDGHTVVIAQFAPAAALGRIVPGQTGQIRLEGFPWVQYGSVSAVVTRVDSEVRNGAVRVELAVNNSHTIRIPLQHGLPGSVEIEVEQVSPVALLLRTVGQMVTRPRSPYQDRAAQQPDVDR